MPLPWWSQLYLPLPSWQHISLFQLPLTHNIQLAEVLMTFNLQNTEMFEDTNWWTTFEILDAMMLTLFNFIEFTWPSFNKCISNKFSKLKLRNIDLTILSSLNNLLDNALTNQSFKYLTFSSSKVHKHSTNLCYTRWQHFIQLYQYQG